MCICIQFQVSVYSNAIATRVAYVNTVRAKDTLAMTERVRAPERRTTRYAALALGEGARAYETDPIATSAIPSQSELGARVGARTVAEKMSDRKR